ncbi:hypothetical protein [Rhodococcus sp. (in: high G+C Gram-positive bacteria)]|uniref:hypothetical protein n=1 Tax=Rhodococcus sp. TaxID=1831 RepID=UPI001A2B01AC|nr:hypothetical protein [Rhodococcus sp. (in: high G+C Gram-positive bacteria)]MBJ7479237.1 hypothetical protein [Rhodococcus sp. (in: high G+C Gram-positive bacteria)]
MNVIARVFAELTVRKPQPASPLQYRVSLHTGSELTETSQFAIEPTDALMFRTQAGTVTAVTIQLPERTQRAVAIAGLDAGDVVFARILYNSSEHWLRMRQWESFAGTLTAEFSREYPSYRWNERDGYFMEALIEPSPPVPFDEHHPHYEGSAQQHRTDLAYDVGGSF